MNIGNIPSYSDLQKGPDFLSQNGALLGLGVGLLPYLYKWLNGSSSNPNRIASVEDTAKLFPGAQASDLPSYAAANPGITNGWSGAVGGAPATGTTNTTGTDLASGLTNLSKAFGSASSAFGGSQSSGTPQAPPPPAPANYAGTGSRPTTFNLPGMTGTRAGTARSADAFGSAPGITGDTQNPLLAALARFGIYV